MCCGLRLSHRDYGSSWRGWRIGNTPTETRSLSTCSTRQPRRCGGRCSATDHRHRPLSSIRPRHRGATRAGSSQADARLPTRDTVHEFQRVVCGYPRLALLARSSDQPWWALDTWTPRCDPRIPLRDREPHADQACRPGRLQIPWLRAAVKWHLGTVLEAGILSWTTIGHDRLCGLNAARPLAEHTGRSCGAHRRHHHGRPFGGGFSPLAQRPPKSGCAPASHPPEGRARGRSTTASGPSWS